MISPWDADRIFQDNPALRSHIAWDNYERRGFEEPTTPEADENDLVLVCEIYFENERQEADARLIARAPEQEAIIAELLGALKALCATQAENNRGRAIAWKAAIKTIAKAEDGAFAE
jgi:hypothetical protein